jgi:hypothetical protein
MARGSFGYWALIVFVGTIISTAIVVMIALVIFESYRAFKFANLYDDIRYVCFVCFLDCRMLLHCSLTSLFVAKLGQIHGVVSDFTERRMVKRIATAADGSTAMQISFGRTYAGGKVGACCCTVVIVHPLRHRHRRYSFVTKYPLSPPLCKPTHVPQPFCLPLPTLLHAPPCPSLAHHHRDVDCR